MTAAAALTLLRDAGLTLTIDGGDLVVKPADRLTPELAVLALTHKVGLMVVLASDAFSTALPDLFPPGVCLDCGGPALRDGMHFCSGCRNRAAS